MSLLKRLVDVKPTPALERTWPLIKDLKDQPKSKYILVTGSTKPVYYAVDSMSIETGVASFWRECEGMPVFMCRAQEGVWVLVRRDQVILVSEREMAEAAKRDQDEALTFYSKLDPEMVRKAQEEGTQQPVYVMTGGQHNHAAPPEEDKRPMPGHYL